MKFKVGDKVKIIKYYKDDEKSIFSLGYQTIVVSIVSDSYVNIKLPNDPSYIMENFQLQLVTKNNKGEVNMDKYLVTWNTREVDPAKGFETVDKAKEFVNELAETLECPETGEEVVLDSIKLYQISKMWKPNFTATWEEVNPTKTKKKATKKRK